MPNKSITCKHTHRFASKKLPTYKISPNNIFTFKRFAIIAVTIFLTSCTIISTHKKNRIENEPINPPQPGILHLDVNRAQITPPFLRPQFIGIALSGGGSRAANFAAATMEELDKFGLVRSSNIISSVSGGGLAAGYYALNGPATDWGLLKQKLGTNFLKKFLQKWAAPWNWPSIAITDQTKTDVMGKVFDDILFHGKTYQDLPEAGPVFLANATDIYCVTCASTR